MRRRPLVVVAVVIVLAVAGVAWFLGRDSLDRVDIDRSVADLAEVVTAEGGGGDGAPAEPFEPTGTWRVDPDLVPFDYPTERGSYVGYRIDEELAGVGAVTAVGRSPLVEGEVVIDGSRVLEAVIRADLGGLESDNPNRDGRVRPLLRDRPATFVLTAPVDFGTVPEEGERVAVSAVGRLRIGDVEREVTFELSAGVEGDYLALAGSTVVLLSDLDVAVPSAPIVLRVADEATVEFQLYLARD